LIEGFRFIYTTILVSCNRNVEGYYCKKKGAEGYNHHFAVIKLFPLFFGFPMKYERCQRNE
jgi:hypothetical protein